MENPKYLFESTASFTTYEFVSEGPKGRIRKLVSYAEFGDTGAYNLGFGDKLGDTDNFDDKVITDNGDSKKVLATVAATLYEFINKHPNALVFATGSTVARTRLYRIGISNALDDINKDFVVRGYFEGEWEIFERNRDYSIFLITKKIRT